MATWSDAFPLGVAKPINTVREWAQGIEQSVADAAAASFQANALSGFSYPASARPTPASGAGILLGTQTIVIGADALSGAANNATFCNFFGTYGGSGANNLYCVDSHGIHGFRVCTDGQYLTGMGADHAYSLTYGRNSVFFGPKTGLYKTNVQSGVIIGTGAGYGGGTVLDSVIIGNSACDGNQPADAAAAAADPYAVAGLVAIGVYAARRYKGNHSVFIGNNSGSFTSITGSYNLGIGRSSAGSLTTGSGNTFIGDGCGGNIATGTNNTFVGYFNAAGGDYSNCASLGYNSASLITGNSQVQLGSSSMTVYSQAAIQVRSDARDKKDIADSDLGLGFILALRPVRYYADQRERYLDVVETTQTIDGVEVPSLTHVAVKRDGSRASTRVSYGLIAQEVGKVVTDLGINFSGWQDHSVNGGKDVQTLAYEQFIGPTIRAVQEFYAEWRAANENHETRIRALETELAELRRAA